jgi:dihydroorotate dehydrogenase electron transfer subunit
LFFLADELRNEGHRVDVILGARSGALLLNPIDARRLASVCRTTTEDGSVGERGRVTDVLAETMEKCETEVVYTCGPHPMLAAVTRVCIEQNVPVQVAVEELMGCGYGVCMTCVMPLRRPPKSGPSKNKKEKDDDTIVYARSCTEGPVFNGATVIWNGAADPVSLDQSELSPVGVPTRGVGFEDAGDELAPPGN